MKQQTETRHIYSEAVLIRLREQIINGSLPARTRLVESDLAQAMGTSRGPIRDALKQLAVEGLVAYEPNKGCTVALLSPKDAYEVFFLRGNLEKMALQKGGCRISDRGLLTMEAALEEMRVLAETDKTQMEVHADERFHREIVLSGQMDRLLKMWELLSPLNGAMFLAVKNANLRDPTHVRDLAAPHSRILEAIRQGNLELSCELLDRHYTGTGERIYRLSLLDEINGGLL